MKPKVKYLMTRKKKNYINNADFYVAIINYQDLCAEALSKGKPKPPIPPYIAECFYKVATNFTNNPRFRNKFAMYHQDEMISDALLQCVEYLDRFDRNVGANPFAYFTQFCNNAFVARLDKEKKHLYIKLSGAMMVEDTGVTKDTNENDEQSNDESQDLLSYENYRDFIKDFEKKHNITHGKKKRKKKTENTLWEDE